MIEKNFITKISMISLGVEEIRRYSSFLSEVAVLAESFNGNVGNLFVRPVLETNAKRTDAIFSVAKKHNIYKRYSKN